MGRESTRRDRWRAACAGAVGGGILAVADFMPSVGWLPDPADRLRLGLHLLGLLAGTGALCAVAATELDRLAAPLVSRSRWRPLAATLPHLVLLSPLLVALAVRLFAGGRASRLPALPLLIAGAALSLLVGVGLALHLGRRALRREGVGRWALGAALIGLGCAAAVANRLLYPRHYDAIHGALGAASLAAASLGVALLWARRLRAAPNGLFVALAPALAVALTLGSLLGDHDGRAALLSPRAASARPLMLAVAPALYALPRAASGAAVDAARRRRHVVEEGGLPVWPDAHLVLVTVDALRADHLGAYGYPRRAMGGSLSPTLDRVAAEGVRFDRAWTPTPRSSYAICSLMTGLALLPRGAPRAPTLASALREAGFYTAGFYPDGIFFHQGEQLAAYRDAELGFERRDAEYRDAESRTDAALEELADLQRRGEPRTFLWVHYFDVHEPYESTLLGAEPMDRYDSEIHETDRAIGRLLEGLEGLERDVVLVVSADHGEEFLDHGGRYHGESLYEEQLRVPLLIRAPGLAARIVDTPVSLLDLSPTLRASLGVARAPETDGYDLRALALGRSASRPPVRATEDGLAAVLVWPHKLIEDRRVGTVSLFDLEADPGERASLASEREALLAQLTAELAAFDAP